MNNFEEILVRNKFKITNARIFVLKEFLSSDFPISAEYLINKSKTKNLNEVTIYRTLSSFEKKQIIRRVDLRKDSIYYELADNHHHHIVCSKCGDLEDFDLCIPSELLEKVNKNAKKFSLIKDHSLEFFGICNSCIKEK